MIAFIWIKAHWGTILEWGYAFLNALNALLPAGDGKSIVRKALDVITVLSAPGDPMSIKVPLTKSKLPE